MCEHCVKEEWPDRDTMCIEQGAYMINFKKCRNCGLQDVKTTNRLCCDNDDEESITYQHSCGSCEHIIAEHEYTFKVEGDYQVYEMNCLLCGSAEDQRSILPVDPRGPAM